MKANSTFSISYISIIFALVLSYVITSLSHHYITNVKLRHKDKNDEITLSKSFIQTIILFVISELFCLPKFVIIFKSFF